MQFNEYFIKRANKLGGSIFTSSCEEKSKYTLMHRPLLRAYFWISSIEKCVIGNYNIG